MPARGKLTKAVFDGNAACAATRTAVVMRGEANFGPAMSALTEKQRLFVLYLLESGSDNHTRAAAFAGYASESENSLRVTAHRLAHDAKVQAAMHEEAQRRMRASAIMASSRLIEIANNPMHKDQLRAIGMLLNRVGLHEASEHKVTVEHTMSDSEMRARIVTLCNEMGIDPAKMLGHDAPKAIEADYVEVTDPVEGSTAGLEDVL